MSAAMQRVWQSPGYKRRLSRILKRRWHSNPKRYAERVAISRRNLGPSDGAKRLHAILGDGWYLEHFTPHGPLDVANPTLMIAIEVDGAEHRRPHIQRRDQQKTRALSKIGWTVVRLPEASCLAIGGGCHAND